VAIGCLRGLVLSSTDNFTGRFRLPVYGGRFLSNPSGLTDIGRTVRGNVCRVALNCSASCFCVFVKSSVCGCSESSSSRSRPPPGRCLSIKPKLSFSNYLSQDARTPYDIPYTFAPGKEQIDSRALAAFRPR